MQSREKLTLRGLESVQEDVKTKLEEELEKFQIGEGEFVHLMRSDDSTALLHATKLGSRFAARKLKKSRGRIP